MPRTKLCIHYSAIESGASIYGYINSTEVETLRLPRRRHSIGASPQPTLPKLFPLTSIYYTMSPDNVSGLPHQIELQITNAEHREDIAQIENNAPQAKVIFQDAQAATATEHELTPLDGFKMYPKAVAWSVLITMAVIMDGYDEAFLSQLFAEEAFQKQFGEPFEKGYQVKASWQSGLPNGKTIGIMIGMLLNGYARERFGMKRTMLTAFVALLGLTFILVFGQTPQVLLVGEILCGICFGIFHATAPAYASEVCPTVLRGYLTTFINMCAM